MFEIWLQSHCWARGWTGSSYGHRVTPPRPHPHSLAQESALPEREGESCHLLSRSELEQVTWPF